MRDNNDGGGHCRLTLVAVSAAPHRCAANLGVGPTSGWRPPLPANTLIIIPAYNEEDALPAVLVELASRVPQHDVIVVVDGSTDTTASVARAAGVMVAELPFNLGIGGALRTGFRYAERAGYERAVQFDADGQHDPSEIETLLDALDAGADMVVGSRFSGAPAT